MKTNTTGEGPYCFYFTFFNASGDQAINIYWGRQIPFSEVIEEMKRQIGDGCTYKEQKETVKAHQIKFK